ncbi:MAG: hypothetical protein IKQ46_10060 [Bacteroidales bacterium]|nr:hypothetical protein [Bacteroidales bacterium]
MKTNQLIILSLLLAATTSHAQPYLAALSKPGKAGIELQWSPMSYEAWQLGLTGGYMILILFFFFNSYHLKRYIKQC